MSETAARQFNCDLDPRGDGGWDIWISETPYRGVTTDAVLGEVGERKRIGAAYSSRWYVGSESSERSARSRAEKTVAHCLQRAQRNDIEDALWRANAMRDPVRVTNGTGR